MNTTSIQIDLPAEIYERLQKRSEKQHRSVEEEVVAMVAESFATHSQLPADLQQELSQLDLLTDDELWQAAQMTAPTEKTARMQELVEKQQLEGLTAGEQEEAALLSLYFNRVMLVRGKAAVLLKERGHNIDSLAAE